MERTLVLLVALLLVGCATASDQNRRLPPSVTGGSSSGAGVSSPGPDGTARGEEPGGVRVEERSGNLVLTLNRTVLFDTGSTAIKRRAWPKLDEVAKFLLRYPDRMVLVLGHADRNPMQTESVPSNWELSALRAVAVVKYISRLPGLDSSRLVAAGASSHRNPSGGPSSSATGRRVEIHLLDVKLPGKTLEVPLK